MLTSFLVCLGLLLGAAPELSARAGAGPGRTRASAFQQRLGLARPLALLDSSDPEERLNGIRRLAGLGSAAAIERLVAFVLDGRSRLSGREALVLARALGSQGALPKVPLALAALMHRRAPAGAAPDEAELFRLGSQVAALALAASGTREGASVLARALHAGGASGEMARLALEAHPPLLLSPLLDEPGEPSVEFARLLGALGDQRAFHTLRNWVRSADVEVRAAAAIALTELGDLETVPLARAWLRQESELLRSAALRVLISTRQPEAVVELAKQLGAPGVSPEVRALALGFPRPEFAEIARGRVRSADTQASEAEFWWTLLGRLGAPGVEELERGLSDPAHGFRAAHALSRSGSVEARAALLGALERGVALPLSVRAARLREHHGDDEMGPLARRVDELARSKGAVDRFAAAWSASLGGAEAAINEIASGDPVRVFAAANNALVFDARVFERAGALLASAPEPLGVALAFALMHPRGRSNVPSERLRELIEARGSAAPLAIRALSSRLVPRPGSEPDRFLDHPDRIVRAHAARGLGESDHPGATGLLLRHFEFEADASVRHAIVCALALRGGSRAERALALARNLDPSDAVRSAARLGLDGAELGDPPPGAETLWAEIRHASGDSGRAHAAPPPALLEVGPGLALPVFADESGLLVVSGVGEGTLGIRLQ